MATNETKLVLTAEDRTAAAFRSIESSLRGLEGSFGRLSGLMAGFAGGAMVAAFGAAIRASEDAAQAQRKLDAVLRATGNTTGYTADQLSKLSDKLALTSSFDDEGFRTATATLIRFGNIGGENLEKVLKLSADYAALTGTDLVSASEKLGRALNNPAEGLKKLEKNFGDLGKETEDAIKLQAELGNSSGALGLAIEALQKKIGGGDEAMNAGLTGAVKQLKKAFNELLETIGGAADNSVTVGVLDAISSYLRGIKAVMEGGWTEKLLAIIGASTGSLPTILGALGNRAPGTVTPGAPGANPADFAAMNAIEQKEIAAREAAYRKSLLDRYTANKKAAEDWQREEARLRSLDSASWVKKIDEDTARYEDGLREEAKLAQAFYEEVERLRKVDDAGWIAKIEADIKEYEDGLRLQAKMTDEFYRQKHEAETAEWRRFGDTLASGFTSMFSDLLDGSLRSWKDFARSLADIFKSAVVDFVGTAIRAMMNNLMTSLASGGASLSGMMSGANPFALAFAGGSIAGMGITNALGSGPRGQQVGTVAGGSLAMAGFALGGPIGAVVGAVIGGLIGHFTDPDGLATRSATFGPRAGSTGPTGYGYTSPFGSFGLSDTNWFSDADMGEALKKYFAEMGRWEGSVASYLTPEEIARVTGALSGPGGRYGFGTEHGDFSGTLGSITADRATAILTAIDPLLAKLIEGFQGTGEELGTFVLQLLSVRQALEGMHLNGLTMESLQAWTSAGETVVDTFNRVAGQWNWFVSNFYTDAEKLDMAQKDVIDTFAALGIEIPDGLAGFRDLVSGIDLSTEAGRGLWDILMKVAPSFLLVTNAANDATDATDDLADALERQAELQRRIEESVRSDRLQRLDRIIGARAGLQEFRNGLLLNTDLTTLDPYQRLNEARQQYEGTLFQARGGDLGAAGQLGGMADVYLRIAREIFASSSAYVDIFNRVTGDVAAVDARLEIDQQMLEATLGISHTMIEVRDLLIEIRDQPTADARR